jgi:tRNA-splicing ligase RtcB
VTTIDINGNITKIFLERNEIDTETFKQIKAMTAHECIKNARVMPDCHKGSGCCVGFTFHLSDKIVPSYIGGDIGCGICTYNLGIFNHNKKEKQIDNLIRSLIPLGNGHECVNIKSVAETKDYEWLFDHASYVAEKFVQTYKNKFSIDISTYAPVYNNEWFIKMCERIGADFEFVEKEIGTLGGGNHYIEINIDSKNNKYLTIHSGSRNLGSKICEYHQKKTIDKFSWDDYNKCMNEFNATNPDATKKQIKGESAKIKKILEDNIHKPYLHDEEAYAYYFDMIFAQTFAQLNRRIMTKRIVNCMAYGVGPYDESKLIESIHNTIDFEDMIVRKGAIRAHLDEICIVSLNMRDGIMLCKGKGDPDWNFSGPHGLGRIVDRGRAKAKFRLHDFQKEMSDVYSTSVCTETLDESPMAYKDVQMVISASEPNLKIIEQLKPIINIKAI